MQPKPRMLQAELEQAQESYDALQQMETYVSLVVEEKDMSRWISSKNAHADKEIS